MEKVFLDHLVNEDIGNGDHTSLATIPATERGRAHLLVKEQGILAGVNVALEVFNHMDSELTVNVSIKDGAEVKPGDVAFIVEGSVQSILRSERLVLNLMQRMSGIATTTRVYSDRVRDLGTKILDTRKTVPGLREIDKEAVKIGGGTNHRFGLYDMVMIKDNHVDFSNGIKEAIESTKKYLQSNNIDIAIEVEARNIEDVAKILEVEGVKRILLDNFTPEKTKEAVEFINGRVETESSGGITLDTIRSYAECGVDYISVGALTHSVKGLDLSLKAI